MKNQMDRIESMIDGMTEMANNKQMSTTVSLLTLIVVGSLLVLIFANIIGD